MAGMKLVGSLMGSVEDLFEKAGGMATVYQLQVLLGEVASSDSSPAAQDLATKLLSVFIAKPN